MSSPLDMLASFKAAMQFAHAASMFHSGSSTNLPSQSLAGEATTSIEPIKSLIPPKVDSAGAMDLMIAPLDAKLGLATLQPHHLASGLQQLKAAADAANGAANMSPMLDSNCLFALGNTPMNINGIDAAALERQLLMMTASGMNLNVLQQLDGLQPLLMQQAGLGSLMNLPFLPAATAAALRNAMTPSLPGTTIEKPLESFVIGKAGPMGQQGDGIGNDTKLGPQPPMGQPGHNASTQPQQNNEQPKSTLLHAFNVTSKRGTGAKRAPRGPREKTERSSRYRGVTKHRRSGRWEAHCWSKDLGRQVYLGGYECEEHAGEAYDIAALKCKGERVKTNFEISKYQDLLACIDRMTLEELVMAIRRQSQGFSRGTSSYRGVTKHPSERWEARIGIPGSKHIYLGLYPEEKEAARVYDQALVRLRGRIAATNFALSDYSAEMADYHKMQAKILEEDPRFIEIQTNPSLFDRWVKLGQDGFPDLLKALQPSQAAAAAAVDEALAGIEEILEEVGVIGNGG